MYALKSDTAKDCPSDVTIAMDMNQSIYSGLDSLFYGIKREVRKLNVTYRCSVEIDALAESLRKNNDDYLEEEDKTEHIKPQGSNGILPIICEYSNTADEKLYIVELIKRWQEKDKNIIIGILSTTNIQNDVYSEWMTDAGIAHEKKDEEIIQDEIIKNCPLAYVGMTRAMTVLVITYSGIRSRFIGEMDQSLYRFDTSGLTESSTKTSTSKSVKFSSTGFTRISCSSSRSTSTVSSSRASSRMAFSGNSTRTSSSKSSSVDLKGYFQSKGLEVVDKRGSGGCLWVVGDDKKLKPYLDKVKKLYGAYGDFGAGRATKHRRGWLTKCSK